MTCSLPASDSVTAKVIVPSPSAAELSAIKSSGTAGTPVVPEPWGDHPLGVSPFSARTCTWYSLDASSPEIVVLVPVTVPVQAVQTVAGTLRYSTS